ncbi:MAG: TPM domain-containing protein [Rhodothermaceae bacterium]|nr:TPM domain-containing protein [Rhodothermaceae bacterium]MXX57427.1 TPM domain-containing protein [Rhodothermaceae bacterium]MYD19501.1 TPM domain-containing protein [Rhodothermaceae bacterium]MYD55859.1 TPM domain-containing protein [Rhodothermaceae bacterium]MYI44458.1 TPM domain-containing protein [Rhodothermaceae bacterium]
MSMWKHIVFFLLTVIVFGCMIADQPLEPDWIVDQADVLEAEDEYELMNMVSAFYDSSSVALVGVTVESLQQQSIEAYTEAIYTSWELGAPETNNGIMVLLAPVERLVHITVGNGIAWELSAQVLDSIKVEMANFFGTGEYRAGLESGFRSLMTRAGALTWSIDYTSISDVQADSSRSIGRILMTDCVITGFEEDLVVATDNEGNEIRLIVSMDVPMLSVEDVIGFTGRITQTTPLQAHVLNLSIDFPF